jgi:hypothetical protein
MGKISSTTASNGFDSIRATNPDGTNLVLSEKKLRRFPRTEKNKDPIDVEICGIHQSSIDSGDNHDSSSLFQPKKSIIVSDADGQGANSTVRRGIWHCSIYIFAKAFFLEGPLAVIEGSIRAALFTVGCLVTLLLAGLCCKGSLLATSYFLFRDAILCLAAVITLCLPGTSCSVYRWYKEENDWELAPIPTIFGWVDSRRFVSFAFGNGCFACNVQNDSSTYNATDRDQTDGISSSGSSLQGNEQELLGRHCYDSWSGVIFMEPVKIRTFIMRIISDDNTIDGLRQPAVKIKKSSNKKYSAVGANDDDIVGLP